LSCVRKSLIFLIANFSNRRAPAYYNLPMDKSISITHSIAIQSGLKFTFAKYMYMYMIYKYKHKLKIKNEFRVRKKKISLYRKSIFFFSMSNFKAICTSIPSHTNCMCFFLCENKFSHRRALMTILLYISYIKIYIILYY